MKFKYKRVEHRFEEDINELQKQLLKKGYEVSKSDIGLAWEHYSHDLCAGWMCLNELPEENISILLEYLEEVEE